jgi:hypothetical protein
VYKASASGLTLVEILISLMLLSIVILSINVYLVKLGSTIQAYEGLIRSNIELSRLEVTLRQQLDKATWIDPTSYNKKIVFTTLDDSGNPSTIGYRITTSGGKTVLEYSPDGTTWGQSPYSMSASSTYSIDSGEFLFCGYSNHCTRFNDDITVDGLYTSGSDTRTQVSGSSLLTNAFYAQKIVLSGFIFNRQGGMQVTWPDIYQHLPSQHVATATQLMQSINVNPSTNADFDSGFSAKGIAYDFVNRRLILVGANAGSNYIYQLSRDGIRMDNQGSNSVGSAVSFDDACLDADAHTLLTWKSPGTFTKYDLATSTPGTSTDSFSITFTGASYFNTSGTADALACDPVTSGKFYMIGRTSGGTPSIKVISRSPGTTTLSSTISSLPAGMNNVSNEGMTIDPLTGDFYVLQSTITGSAPNKTVTFYHLTQASPSTVDTFTVNISTLGSTATTPTSGWGITFDPFNNHMFMVDGQTQKIYEFIPPRLLSPIR